jgi:hypothetical protein
MEPGDRRVELPPHPVPTEAQAYVASMTPAQRELHELAIKMLGSSYFVERTHGFAKWKAAAAAQKS